MEDLLGSTPNGRVPLYARTCLEPFRAAPMKAQVLRPNYENRGMAAQDRKGPKKNPDNRSPKQSTSEISKLIQAVFDMKAEMGSMRKAWLKAGISFERS